MPNPNAILLTSLLLIYCVLTDNTIDVDCHQCGTYVCMTFTGAVLRGQDIEMVTTTCQQLGNFPGKITFTCGAGGCSQGCLMTEAWAGRTPYSTCTTTATGKDEVDALNYVYSEQEGDPEYSLTYDWCGCDKKDEGLSVGVIIGIAVGAVVGVAVLAGVGYYCLKKRKGKGQQLIPQRRSINEPKPVRRSVQQSRPERKSRRDEPAPARDSKQQNKSFMFLQ